MKYQSKAVWLVCILIILSVVTVMLWRRERYWVPQGKFPPATRLMIAARDGDLTRVAAFIEQGRDINESTDLGQTAFFFAVVGGNYDIAKLLVSKGAIPNLDDSEEEIMIASIARRGDVKFLEYLFEKAGKGPACWRVLEVLAGLCEVRPLDTILKSLGKNALWGVDAIRRFSQMDTDCSSEIKRLVAEYEN